MNKKQVLKYYAQDKFDFGSPEDFSKFYNDYGPFLASRLASGLIAGGIGNEIGRRTPSLKIAGHEIPRAAALGLTLPALYLGANNPTPLGGLVSGAMSGLGIGYGFSEPDQAQLPEARAKAVAHKNKGEPKKWITVRGKRIPIYE